MTPAEVPNYPEYVVLKVTVPSSPTMPKTWRQRVTAQRYDKFFCHFIGFRDNNLHRPILVCESIDLHLLFDVWYCVVLCWWWKMLWCMWWCWCWCCCCGYLWYCLVMQGFASFDEVPPFLHSVVSIPLALLYPGTNKQRILVNTGTNKQTKNTRKFFHI
jgi:hypothetical protein